jgi:hypothetical protein
MVDCKMTQVVEQLPSEHEPLSSNPRTRRRRKKKGRKEEEGGEGGRVGE